MAEITVSSFEIPSLQFEGVETGELRLYASRTFLDSDGEIHLGGAEGDQQGFYQACPFTVTDAVATVASFVTVSTLDAQDNAPATILMTGALFSSDGAFLGSLFSGWQFPATTPTTFAALYNVNRSTTLPIAPITLVTQQQMIDYVDSVLGEQAYASDVVAGITYLSAAPDSALQPTAEGSNSTRLISSLTYAALAALTAITGALKFCTDRLKGLYYKTAATIWCSLTGRANVLDHGCVGDGSTSCRAALNTLFNTTLATTGGTVYFPHYQNAANTDYLIDSSLSIPANVVLEFAVGARLKVSTGVTVTINTSNINARKQHVFNCQGTGKIVFSTTSTPTLWVSWWGAVGDNATNNQTSIQAAIQCAYDSGGGVVYFPVGIYLVNGTLGAQNGVLELPQTSGALVTIKFLGEIVTRTGSSIATNGVIIKSTTAGSGSYPAILSGRAYTGGTSFNNVIPEVENITFRTFDNPTLGGIQFHNTLDAHIRNVMVDPGVSFASVSEPTHNQVAALVMPTVNNFTESHIENYSGYGYWEGARVSEHTRFIGRVSVSKCKVGLIAEGGYRPLSGDVIIEDCPLSIYIEGASVLHLNANIERYDFPASGVSTWYQSSAGQDIVDAGAAGRGFINYTLTIGNVGFTNLELSNTGIVATQLRVANVYRPVDWPQTLRLYHATDARLQFVNSYSTNGSNVQGLTSGSLVDLHISGNAINSSGTWAYTTNGQPAWNLFLAPSSDAFGIRHVVAGAGAITWADFFMLDNVGNATLKGKLKLSGSTSGSVGLAVPAVAGTNTLTLPAGTTDFSATGGASQVVKQTSAGGAFTVAQLAASDLSDGNTGTGAVAHAVSPTFSTSVTMADGANIVLNTTTGTKIGTVGGGAGQKLAFWGSTPVVQPVLATGAAHTVDDIISFLQTLGLCRQS